MSGLCLTLFFAWQKNAYRRPGFSTGVNKYVLMVYIYFYVNYEQIIEDFSQMRRIFVHNTQKAKQCIYLCSGKREGYSCEAIS